MNTAEEFLTLCSRHYDVLVEKMERLQKKCSAESILAWIEMVAGFAAMHHPGRFADGRMENVALAIGANLPAQRGEKWISTLAMDAGSGKRTSKRRVLHITTLSTSYGGHARVILNWIKKDQSSVHSLVVTRQKSTPLFNELTEAVTLSGGRFVSMPASASVIEGARWLRKFASETADLVILHLLPNDILPLVAFADCGGVPVAQVNLCDHLFWVGSSVADMTIHLRQLGITTSMELRYTRNNHILPIPLYETHATLSRNDARAILGIPESHIMLLTVGRSVKYAPSKRHNFFRTAKEILGRHPEAHLYLVGVKENDHAASPRFVRHDHMHFVGPVEDASVWQKAADVYLEGFPFGSQTSLLESILPGVPCVRVFGPSSPLLAAEDMSVEEAIDTPRDEEDYVQRASDFIVDHSKRIRVGNVLRERVLYDHVDDTWNQYLANIYSVLENLSHLPLRIPHVCDSTRSVDLAISEYHLSRFLDTNVDKVLEHIVHEFIMSTAYSLRQKGFHSDALRVVRMASNEQWLDKKVMLATVKILLYRYLFRYALVSKVS